MPGPTATPTAAYRCGSHSPAASYEQIARFPDTHKGKCFSFRGEVEQDTVLGFRINITEGRYSWDDDIFVLSGFDDSCIGTEGRVLEDDIVEFHGTAEGTWTYETIFGAGRGIPLVFCIGGAAEPWPTREYQQELWDAYQALLKRNQEN